ncbi:c-type cytochrome [Pontibacter anaerobius]|uniref:C-type cytochrome n=1 Tax=Pontibacter anaerobius TaxID=2993940 RepID=A0ABT3RDD9_9BACT|nr:c-type cytochrome [Pontibacter anaerobius]MCX2739760.1 c-type cytochrome [Pontibacter anaerobius]
MKKNLLILGCLAFTLACGNSSDNAAEEASVPEEGTYSANGEMDSTSGAAVSAASKQSEVDTNRMDIGNDRTEGGAIAAGGNYENGAKLIAASDCLSCHQEEKKLVGPSYVEVAGKYEMNDKNVDYLADKIIKGGAGVWGQVPMTPHPTIEKEDAKEMARYILSLNK